MTKTGIIGHRGAAGIALENSRTSFLAALEQDVDAIECDVQATKDRKLVVMHDPHTGRVASRQLIAKIQTLAELQALPLNNGQHLLSLDEVCKLVGKRKPLVIDIKSAGCIAEVLRVVNANPEMRFSFTSLLNNELSKLQKSRPDIPIFVRDSLNNPIEILRTAHLMHAAGISMNKWFMNPFTYWLARYSKLEVRVYSVDSPLFAWLLRRLYPRIVIYSNHPEKLIKKSSNNP